MIKVYDLLKDRIKNILVLNIISVCFSVLNLGGKVLEHYNVILQQDKQTNFCIIVSGFSC